MVIVHNIRVSAMIRLIGLSMYRCALNSTLLTITIRGRRRPVNRFETNFTKDSEIRHGGRERSLTAPWRADMIILVKDGAVSG